MYCVSETNHNPNLCGTDDPTTLVVPVFSSCLSTLLLKDLYVAPSFSFSFLFFLRAV